MREWSGRQRLAREVHPAVFHGLVWVDTFVRRQHTIVWAAVADPSGTENLQEGLAESPESPQGDLGPSARDQKPITHIQILGGFQSRAKARMVADTVLSIVRPDWPGMPLFGSFLTQPDVVGVLREVSAQADSRPRDHDGIPKDRLSPLGRSEVAVLTAQIEQIQTSVHDWRFLLVNARSTSKRRNIIPALVRLRNFVPVAVVPFGHDTFKKKLRIELDGAVMDWTNARACRESAFMTDEMFQTVDRILQHCDGVLAERYGARPSANLVIEHLVENAAEHRRVASYNMFGMSQMGVA